MPPGRFIVVEGGDGAGKGSLITALAQWFAARGRDLLVTREPGGTPEGLALRSLLLAQAGEAWDRRAELLLMTAARVQHVTRLIRPALAAGRVVLCDRFIGSTLAYQGGGRGLDRHLILDLHRTMVDDLWPDLTLWLDVVPATGLARSRARLSGDAGLDEGRFESLELDFHQRVRDSYARLADDLPGWTRIDANQTLEQVIRAAEAAIAATDRPVSQAAGCG